PVIGVILMVAITVILAAVIAAFVFGYGAPAAAPQASMRITEAAAGGTITIEHTGGDGVVLNDTLVIVTPDATAPGDYKNNGDLNNPSTNLGTEEIFEPGEISTETVDGGLELGDTCKVTIIHTPSGQQIFSAIATVTA
ncbi:MAG: type IV pilin N-terminal domain-containing protein, partial [Methanophagales archaeon]|nr:type IV pilin N-terminal domain-containing protein [Methanophagales archaeon]